jgi:tetratricopeptide (TPR) repeat protein
VSSSPWQLGQYVAYDLHKVFALQGMKVNREIGEVSLNIPADSFLLSNDYKNFSLFRSYKQRIADGGSINTDSLVMSNPEYYHAYVIAGDYCWKQKKFEQALSYYEQALTKIIATKKEADHIKSQIADCIKKISP